MSDFFYITAFEKLFDLIRVCERAGVVKHADNLAYVINASFYLLVAAE